MGQTKMRFQPAFWLASFNKAKEFLYFQDVDTGGTQGDAYACHSTKDSVSFMVTGEKLSQVSFPAVWSKADVTLKFQKLAVRKPVHSLFSSSTE